MTHAKVFGIGFHKTGTKSLAAAFRRLGYRVTGPNGLSAPDIADIYLDMCRAHSRNYDAFQDNPWPLVFREMSLMWPDAKFVLTLRDPQAWIASVTSHFGSQPTRMRKLIYGHGAPAGHEAEYLNRFNRHEQEVRTFFSDQPERLLILRIAEGEGYEKICPFLDKDIIKEPFPFRNRAASRSGA
jgi:hypothetical protein